MATVIRSLATCLALLLPAAAVAEEGMVEIREYRVLRDGDEIGSHVFTILQEDDRTTVNVKTDIKVKVAFITAFRFEHERTEVWEEDQLISMESTTNDDGDEYSISAWSTDGGYSRNVNGRTDMLDDAMGVASFWDRDLILASDSFFSAVVDETYDVSISAPDTDTLLIGGRDYDAEYYRMSGDLEYDLWYDPKGNPLKVAFEDRGSHIEWILK